MDLPQVLSAYRTFNPAGWVAIYRVMPTWLGLVCVVLGVALLLVGGGKLFRFVAAPVGALLGFLWAPVVADHFGLQADANLVGLVGGAVVGLGAFVVPPVAVFVGVGLPAGFVGGNLAGQNDWLLGFLPAFLAVGTLAAIASRWIGCVMAATLGAWLLVIGLLSSLHFVGVVAAVASQPWGVILAAALFAIAGSIYQLFVRPSPQEAEKERIEKQIARRRIEEKRAVEKRWSARSED